MYRWRLRFKGQRGVIRTSEDEAVEQQRYKAYAIEINRFCIGFLRAGFRNRLKGLIMGPRIQNESSGLRFVDRKEVHFARPAFEKKKRRLL